MPGAGNGAGGDPASTLGVKVDEDNGAESWGGVDEGAVETGGKGAGVTGLTEAEGGVAGVPAGAGTGLTVAVTGGAAAVGAVTDGVDGVVGAAAVGGASGSDARWPGKSLTKVLRETSPLSFPGDPTTLTIAGRLR